MPLCSQTDWIFESLADQNSEILCWRFQFCAQLTPSNEKYWQKGTRKFYSQAIWPSFSRPSTQEGRGTWLPQSPRGVVDFDFVSYSLSSGHSKLLQPCLENPGCLWGCYCHFIWSCQEILFLKLLRCRNRSRQQYENILSGCLPVPTAHCTDVAAMVKADQSFNFEKNTENTDLNTVFTSQKYICGLSIIQQIKHWTFIHRKQLYKRCL